MEGRRALLAPAIPERRGRVGSVRRWACLSGLVLAGAGILASPAVGANPHVESAAATMGSPTILGPANVTWDYGLDVAFRLAGLGKNLTGATVTLSATANLTVNQVAPSGGTNSSAIDLGSVGVGPAATVISVVQTILPPPSGTNTSTVQVTGAGFLPTLTADKKGNATGTLTIPGELAASSTGDQCVQVSWTDITLTIDSLTFNVPGVSDEYDSTGSFCDADA